jgi:hypothetical protein
MNIIGILMGIAPNMWIAFDDIAIFTILILLVPGHALPCTSLKTLEYYHTLDSFTDIYVERITDVIHLLASSSDKVVILIKPIRNGSQLLVTQKYFIQPKLPVEHSVIWGI